MLKTLSFFRSPDAPTNSVGADVPEPRKAKRKNILPDSDAQLAELGLYAAGIWQKEAWLTLRYTNHTTLAARSTEYQAAIARRRQAGGDRPTNALRIEQLDEQINENLYRVKGMLTDKYDRKSAPAYFTKMGIVRKSRNYILPRERSQRSAALAQLVKGLTEESFNTAAHPFGTAYWAPIATEYAQLVTDLTDDSGAISEAVGEKDLIRDEIERTLRSIGKVLDGNFPDAAEYKSQLRLWGFQRESY